MKHILIPIIVQDIFSKNILMFAWCKKNNLENTIKNKIVIYWSRKRKSNWLKGLSSKHYQYIYCCTLDCDNDTILIKIEQILITSCHEGNFSCFFKKIY